MTRKTLVEIFGTIRKELKLPTTFPSGIQILNHLISMGLATRIHVEDAGSSGPSTEFFQLGFQGLSEKDVDPLELLQSFSRNGVICYMSALCHFELTTQVPTHHHIAIPVKRPVEKAEPRREDAATPIPMEEAAKRSSLGKMIFSYGGIPYYSTKRVAPSLPGIKERVIYPWAIIRMTTIEQTLLDTLQYPYHCGGPEAVFEAWQTAKGRCHNETFLDLLKKMDIPPLTRRSAAAFDLFGYSISKGFADYLNGIKEQFHTETPPLPIPLLKGLAFSRLDTKWNVLIP